MNWCCLIRPLVSLPAEPASARKQAVYAQCIIGSFDPSKIWFLYILVTGTSAVGTKKYSLPSPWTLYASSSNLGNWPVPVILSRLTINGGNTSVYPCFVVWVSRKKLTIALSSFAPKSLYTVNLEPLIFAAVSGSRIPKSAPRSQCAFGSKSNLVGSPNFLISTLSSSVIPWGTVGLGILGSVSI